MSEKRAITCDGPECGKDLTTTGNCEDWRISLRDERIPSLGGVVTAMSIQPKLSGVSVHFCSSKCLRAWVQARWSNP